MARVSTRESGSDVVGTLYVLEDESASSRVEVSPTRGALVTAMRVGERDVLYMDESTLFDASKSVRGGVPVLFPAPGKTADDTWRDGERALPMKQHGFARNLPWKVVATGTEGVASVKLELAANERTRESFPWDFRAELCFSLRGGTLLIDATVSNDGGRMMPYGLGFHPYFAVADKAHARIDTRATKAFDNVTKRVIPFTGFDFTVKELDLHLVDHGSTASALHVQEGGRVDVRASGEFARWVVWTVAGKPFICLEPWTCPGNALNTGDGLLHVPPGASRKSWVEIAASR